MSETRGCIGRAFRFGLGCSFALLLLVGGWILFGIWTSSKKAPELTVSERETAVSKLAALETSLRTSQPFKSEFTEAELTLLAQQYLDRHGVAGDVDVALPGDDVRLSFRMPLEHLERWVSVEQLPSWLGSEVRGALRIHLGVVGKQARAELEGVSLYGVPLPKSLLGSEANANLFELLDADTAAILRRVGSLQVRDSTLFVEID